MLGIIYSLNCPTTNEIKYIGQTIHTLRSRLTKHLCDRSGNKKGTWITSLKNRKLKPTINLIFVSERKNLNYWEKFFVRKFKQLGYDLKNSTEGGECYDEMVKTRKANGWIVSEETKRKMREAWKKKRESKIPKLKKHVSRLLLSDAKIMYVKQNYKKRFYTTVQLGKELNVSPSTIYNAVMNTGSYKNKGI